MSLAEYASLQRRLGERIIERDGVIWQQVRPLFYRPLLPVEPVQAAPIRPPCAWPGAFQYLVRDPQTANSTMSFVMLDELDRYSLHGLSHKRRHLITYAARRFEVRRLHDGNELKAQGYRAYLSFYRRTGYRYRSDRINETAFRAWADTLVQQPKTLLLGAFGPEGLVAVSASFWVSRTLVYASLFCETAAMQQNVGELLFHELRALAARQSGIDRIFVRRYQGGNSLDQYYLMRGCKLVREPARLEIPSLVSASIRWFMPRTHAMLYHGR